ncbi:MAG: hypothetical protein LUE93_02310 [Bacteroides sp.]|nr:hypothetical protein [Bacteroides sp.]
MRHIKYTLLWATAVILLSGCVKDTIYNTDHPSEAKLVSLSTDWSDRGAEVDKPVSYTVATTGMAETATAGKITLDKLLEAGSYTFYIYSTASGITCADGLATVATVTAPQERQEDYIEPLPGWLLAGTQVATLEKDTDYDLTIQATQYVRQLTLIIEPDGDAADHIAGIEATLSGVAGEWNISMDIPQSDAVNVAPKFALRISGEYAGMWIATVRLLGITGSRQKLTGTVTVTGQEEPAYLESDLAEVLAAFNDDKNTPLILKSGVTVETDETAAGFTATIRGWQQVGGGTGIAN